MSDDHIAVKDADAGARLLVGMGNIDHGDDAVGCIAARRLAVPGWRGMDVGAVPENHTGPIRRAQPRELVIVDAASMGLPPGALRRVRAEDVQSIGFGTHSLPITALLSFLGDAIAGPTTLIAIEPMSLEHEPGLSSPVQHACDQLLELIAADALDTIAAWP